MCTGVEIAAIAFAGATVSKVLTPFPKAPPIPKVASIDDPRVQAAATRERSRTGARQGRRSTLLSTEAGSGEAPRGLI